jgi:CDP-glycerol glycerophosphotransferase (TagB/SpsB family)
LITVAGGDQFPKGYFSELYHIMTNRNSTYAYACGAKYFRWQDGEKASRLTICRGGCEVQPFTDTLNGTVVDLACAKEIPLKCGLPYECEADLLLRLALKWPICISSALQYVCGAGDGSQFQSFLGAYDRAWYVDSLEQFLLPLLEDAEEQLGMLPVFLQYYAMYALQCRFDANLDNRQKHVIGKEEIPAYLTLLRRVLTLVQDEVIMNLHRTPIYARTYPFNRMLLRIKYDQPYLDLTYLPEGETLALVWQGKMIYQLNKVKVNVLFMEYRDGKLEIDATLPDVLDLDRVSYSFLVQGQRFPVKMNEGYTLTKYFGASAYKRHSFHASVPLQQGKHQKLQFAVEYQGQRYLLDFEYQSHFSRLSNGLMNAYWHFGPYLATAATKAIVIAPYSWKAMAKRELALWVELLKRHKRLDLIFLLVRMAYAVTRPYFRRKPIWMFYDKIYKGGDSSEYLYKYAMGKQDGIRKYYLMDQNAVDYQRLKEEGFRPLKRGSVLHRLVFLNADMMIVSNSTVFAFNNYSLKGSNYIRGLVNFHVVCVQHGLSVQKIALAQRRLRDNTRLYFCASKYEIQNLSHPVYDYQGYDALKLTGVPRYDGLVNRDKKQIMISPTWRMQSAMLVSKNEGVERDYNPNFKQTDYFKVYNSLINDPRLIAAAKEYGYKLVYVLHPIVSPQAKDFDQNPYVEIIPATGKMSYEQLFCESSLMVTDFSGIQFDFAYLRKPLVYHHHRDLDAHYEEGVYRYDTMAFGEITHDNEELIDLLCDYMANGCQMKAEYRRRADDFFAFNDHNNCQRIYDVMIDYQHTVVEANR